MSYDLAFWLSGSPIGGKRRVVSALAAYRGFAACDSRLELDSEAYLSAFWYASDFADHVSRVGGVKGFDGPCYSPWLWFDVDRAGDLPGAQQATRRLVGWLTDKAGVNPDALLLFFSGSKGFHLGCPMPSGAEPGADFHKRTRGLAEAVAMAADAMPIDPAIYTKCQPFRSPNSRHSKTGLYKVKLSPAELAGWTIERIQEQARMPRPFDLELPSGQGGLLRELWDKAAAVAVVESKPTTHPEAGGMAAERTKLNSQTLDYIRGGAAEGDRHRLLFSAAANLAEFDCPPALADALLTDSALDSGLSPADARRQIACGLRHGRKGADE